MLLDSRIHIATPEGVELGLPLAGVGARSLAWLIDALIKFVAVSIMSIALPFLDDLGSGLYLIGSFLLLWFYNVGFEVLRNGATPGKKALGLCVMHSNGTPVGWNASVIRNLVRFVDMLPGCYAFGCIAVLLSKHFQRLGDLAAGTVVVFADDSVSTARTSASKPLPVRVPLSLDEQQAILSFAERAPGLNAERAEELAGLLNPVFADVNAERLQGHANWLAGAVHRE